jgi:hypothetical protein
MAVFNNGSITATVTPPQGYTGDYSYELFKYENNNWVSVNGTTEGFTGSFVNPITKSDTTHTFGNPGGFNDNVEGSNTWVGLAPAQYKVIVTTTTGLTCEVEGTTTVGTEDPADPCYGFNISANVDSDTAITVTVLGGTAPFTWTLNGSGASPTPGANGTFTFSGLTPSTFYTIGVVDDNACTDSTSATTTGAADPEFTCPIANFQVADGVEGETIQIGVDATVDVGTLNSVSPATYSPGTNVVYTANITVPSTGYSNSGATITTCTDTASTIVDPCAGFQGIAVTSFTNPTAGASDGSITVSVTGGSGNYTWTLNGNAATPTDNGNETFTFSGLSAAEGAGTQYSIVLTDASCGTDNTQQTLVDPGSGGGGTNNTIYYFHGFDDDAQEPWATESGGFGFVPFTDATADYYLANTIGGGQSDFNSTPVSLDAVMSHLIDNGTVGNYSILDLDAASGIIFAGQPSATVLDFPAITTGFNAQYYFAIPQSLTTTNYTNSGTCNLTNQSDGTSALPGQAADRKEFTYNGILYWLYRMSTPSQGQSYLGFNS